LAMASGEAKIHSFPITPSPSISVTPTITPTMTATPTVTPTITPSITPSSVEYLYTVYGATSTGTGLTGTGDTQGFDGNGNTYPWDRLLNQHPGAVTQNPDGMYTFYDDQLETTIPIGYGPQEKGTISGPYPRWFKPMLTSSPSQVTRGLTITPPSGVSRIKYAMAYVGVEDDISMNVEYVFRNKTTGALVDTITDTILVRNWTLFLGGGTNTLFTGVVTANGTYNTGERSRFYYYRTDSTDPTDEITSITFIDNQQGLGHLARVIGMQYQY